jgi:hypothetical protein
MPLKHRTKLASLDCFDQSFAAIMAHWVIFQVEVHQAWLAFARQNANGPAYGPETSQYFPLLTGLRRCNAAVQLDEGTHRRSHHPSLPSGSLVPHPPPHPL